MTPAITLRPVSPADEAFLCEVYSSTRTEELAPVPWDDAQKAAFLRMQFTAQHQYYQEHYPQAAFDVILVAGQPAGRLYVHRGSDEERIVDIAMLPAWRPRRGDAPDRRAAGGSGARSQTAAHPRRAARSGAWPLRAPRLPGDRGSRRLPVPRMARDGIAETGCVKITWTCAKITWLREDHW